MKKLISIICIFVLCLSLFAGCGKTEISESISEESISEESISEESTSVSESSEQSEAIPKDEPNFNTSPEVFMKQYDINKLISEIPPIDEDMPSYDWYSFEPDIEYSEKVASNIASDEKWEGGYADKLPPINNSIPLTEVLTECGILDIKVGSNYASEGVESILSVHIINDLKNPILFFRKVDDEHFYTVNKLRNGGYNYLFFETVHSYKDGEFITSGDMTDICASGCVYAEKTMQYSDFESLVIGDSIDKVIEIDSAAAVYLLAHESRRHTLPIIMEYYDENMNTRHLLTDGLLTIFYKNIDGKWIIDDMEYSSDFNFTSRFIAVEYPKQFKVLPQDYPPAN